MSTLFIGGGNMASALIAGALGAGMPAADIFCFERSAEQRAHLEKTFGLRCLSVEQVAQSDFDVVVWAVKPQHMKAAIDQLRITSSPLHVSIAAGLPSNILQEWLNSDRVIRTMPNSAATIGAGITGLYARDDISLADRALAESLFSPTGMVIWVDSDTKIDAITAVSGSGPAYAFHFLEGLQAAGQSLGFTESEARELALHTARGAVLQALAGNEAFSTLRKKVTSEKGTTAAAVEVLDRRTTQPALCEAVGAAFFRAQEIASEWADQP